MGIMGFNSICYREYGWRWRIYASSKFSTSIRANGFYTRMEYYRPWRIYDCTCIWKFSDSETRIKSCNHKATLKRCFLQKAGKVAGYSMAWGYWLLTGLQQHLLLFPLLDIYQHSFQFYKVSKFFFNKRIFTQNSEKD